MKSSSAIIFASAAAFASAGNPFADPAPAAAADPESTPPGLANDPSAGVDVDVDVAAVLPDDRQRRQTVGSATSVYAATAVSAATCAGVGQSLSTRAECEAAAASLGLVGGVEADNRDGAPPGCICSPGTAPRCWFNTFWGGPAADDRFLLCKDTQASFNAQQASFNSDMLELQESYNSQQASYNSNMLALQAAGLGPESKTANGHLAYPYAAMLDPSGTRRTSFELVGGGWPRDANGHDYLYHSFTYDHADTPTECEQACLARSAEAHGLVGYIIFVSGYSLPCHCLYDAKLTYPEHTVMGGPMHSGTGRITPLDSNMHGTYDFDTYERVYVL